MASSAPELVPEFLIQTRPGSMRVTSVRKHGADFARADAVLDVRLDPEFQRFPQLRAAMHQGDAGAGAEEIERGLGGGVFRADDDDLLIPVGMRVGEVVRDVRQIFAGNAQAVGQVVVAGGDDDLASAIFASHTLTRFLPGSQALPRAKFGSCLAGGQLIRGVDDESAVAAVDAAHALVEARFDAVVLDGAAIVFQGLGAGGLASRGGHGEVANLHALGRGEEEHVGRIVVERVAEASLVDDQGAQAGALDLNGAGEAGRAGADADDVVDWLRLGGHDARSQTARVSDG